jgi:hypothetical protein
MRTARYATPVNFISFQVCWFASVLGAANNIGWLGPLLVGITVPLQIYLLTEDHKAEILFVAVSGIAGFLGETLMIVGSVYTPVGSSELAICPPWMAALWFNFAMLVSISLAWLKGKYLLAAIIGGLLGPVAYWGGEKLGALTVADVSLRGYVVLALIWSLALPLLIYLHSRLAASNKLQ